MARGQGEKQGGALASVAGSGERAGVDGYSDSSSWGGARATSAGLQTPAAVGGPSRRSSLRGKS